MTTAINTNVMSLNSQRNLANNSMNLATTIQRLSSGLRINSAKDDAAGLAISERFSTQIRGMNVAVRNANDGISLAQTAEGAMGEISNNLQRIRELAVQSRNATNSASDRQALNAEAQQLKSEISRVAGQTEFNGLKLLDGSFTSQAFQVGANSGQTITVSSIANASTSQLGTWTAAAEVSGANTVAPDGGATAATPTASVASGAYTAAVATAGGETFTLEIDGQQVYTEASTAGGDSVTAAELDTAIDAFIAASNGAYSKTAGTSVAGGDLVLTKADGTDMTIAISSNFAGTAGAFGGAGFVGTHTGGTPATAADFTAITAGQLTINGENITVGTAANAGARVDALVTAINASSAGVTASNDSGKLALVSNSTADIVIGGSFNATQMADQTGLTAGTTAGAAQTGFASLDISTASGADDAIKAMDGALNAINSGRADMGAVQNRFQSVIANLQTTSENLAASRSRIRDTDFAKETAELARTQILAQAGTAMLAQANQATQNVLSLLR